MLRVFSVGLALLFLLMGSLPAGFGQVPPDQERIRETAQEILSRPEFRMFRRLTTGEPAPGVSEAPAGDSRMKSSRSIPGDPNVPGEGRQPNPEINQRFEDVPAGNGLNEAEKLEDALGREEEFPEADRVDRLLGDPNLAPAAEPPRMPEDVNVRNHPAEEVPGAEANGREQGPEEFQLQEPAPQGNPPRAQNQNPQDHQKPEPRNPRWRSKRNKESLPAPRPRERSEEDQGVGAVFREPPTGPFARFVGAMFHFLAWGILAVICGLILWLIIKAIREYERPYAFAGGGAEGEAVLDLVPEQAPGDLPADVYLAQARKLAEQGRYREAVVQLVLGAMSQVERAGWVRFRRGLTVRDYLQSIHDRPAAYQGFRSMIRVFEPLAFGRREPRQEHYDQSLKGYETGFGPE